MTAHGRLLLRVTDILNSAPIFKLTSEQVTARFMEVLDSAPERTPRYTREFMRGYRQAVTDGWYRRELEFIYILDDKPHSTRKKGPLPRVPAMSIPKGTVCGHAWLVTDANATSADIKWFFKGDVD